MNELKTMLKRPENNNTIENITGPNIDWGKWFFTQLWDNMGRHDLIEDKYTKYVKKAERKELEEYIKNIYVFTQENYRFLKNKLHEEDFENVCISLIGGKSYNIFKLQDAGIKCPPTVPLTTNFYFNAIGLENQALIADIFQECGGEDDIYYPHHDYTSKNIKPIGELIKNKIKHVKLSLRAELAIRQAYEALGGYYVDKILRSATVIEDSPNASFAGCGDSNAQFIQPTPEEDYELFRFNALAVAASGFNFVGIENKLRMLADNGSNFSPRKDPMAITNMSFVYPENYRNLSDDQIVERVSAAYIFHDQMGYDNRTKINMQITVGTGATIADSGKGLPMVSIDREVYYNLDQYNISEIVQTKPDTKIMYAKHKTDANAEAIEYCRIYTPKQSECMLINEAFDYTDPKSDRKKVVSIPENCYSPANDQVLAFKLLDIVRKIESIYPGKNMESEYAMVKDANGNQDIFCVQTRPITVEEKQLVGERPVAPDNLKNYIKTGQVYSNGAVLATVYHERDLPLNTEGHDGPIAYLNITISQDDADRYGQPNIEAFLEEEVTGKNTHAGVQAREQEIPCVSGVGRELKSGQKYYIFGYPDGNGEGMIVEQNEETKEFIKKLEEYHNIQLVNAFDIAKNLKVKPLQHIKLGINVGSIENAKKYGNDGLSVENCTLYRPNAGLSKYFKGFDFLNPEQDPKFQALKEYLEDQVYNSAIQFKSFNYRHCGAQLNEHFSNVEKFIEAAITDQLESFKTENPQFSELLENLLKSMKDKLIIQGLVTENDNILTKFGLEFRNLCTSALINKFGNDKFSPMQGATLTCEHPDFFKKVEIPMIKNVLERLKKEGKNTKIKFTIEFPKSATEVNKMLRWMEEAGLHEYENLQVGPMIENAFMALDVQNVANGQFKSNQLTFSFATNDLGSLTQGVDRQVGGSLETVAQASANPNPMLEIIQTSTTKIKQKFPDSTISVCGEIAATADPYILGILYNLGVREFAMPSNPSKFGKIYDALQLFEERINPKTGKIDLPRQVRLNLGNPELVAKM